MHYNYMIDLQSKLATTNIIKFNLVTLTCKHRCCHFSLPKEMIAGSNESVFAPVSG